jgi:hypothetical protein
MFPAQLHTVHRDFMDVPRIDIAHELGEVDFRVLLPAAALLDDGPQQ